MTTEKIDRATARRVLDTPLQENDANAATIRDYLIALLTGVWRDREGFDGKRPFGNSSWEGEVYIGLTKAGFIAATFDEDGYLDTMDDDQECRANDLVDAAILELGVGQ